MRSESLGRIELIIAADGSVESVKLVGSPYHVQSAMLLSAAKAWQFQPALKEGQPVRYRKTIWIAAQ
jgi:outer membrane biosynthesis protein TonB